MLYKRAAKIHAQYVSQRIKKLNCPTEQKLELIDAIVKNVLDGCEKNNKTKAD